MGAGVSYLKTDLKFVTNRDTVDFEQWAVVAVATYALPAEFAVQVSMGAAVASSLFRDQVGFEVDEELDTRFLGAAALSRRFSWGHKPTIFVSPSLGVGGSYASDFSALDMRIGLMAGLTIANRVSPFAVARGFGGPIDWNGRSGSDAHHYVLGAGLSATLPARLVLAGEYDFAGEKGFSAALVRAF